MSMQQLAEAQTNAEIPVNRNFQTLEHQSVYGQRQSAHSGLTYGYYGGRWGGFSVADGTLTLTNTADNYVVVLRSSGAISVSTSTTNWNDTTNYARVYKLTTAGGVVTATEDHRAGPNGVHGSSGSGASLTQTGEMICGFIGAVVDKTYKIVVKAAHGGTITETTTISASGTCTATFKINTTALGGTANSVSSSEQSQAQASANVFAAGDDIQITISSNSVCLDMSFTIKYTRTLL